MEQGLLQAVALSALQTCVIIDPGDQGGGPVIVTCDLHANAGQIGNGGQIVVSTHGDGNAVTIGSGNVVTTLGGSQSGDGGTISILSPGDLTLTGGLIVADTHVGFGGQILLDATQGINIHNETLSSNGQRAGGIIQMVAHSGKVDIQDSHIKSIGEGTKADGGYVSIKGELIQFSSSNINTSGTGEGLAGTLLVEGFQRIDVGNKVTFANKGQPSVDRGTVGALSLISPELQLGETGQLVLVGLTEDIDVDSISSSGGSLTLNANSAIAGASGGTVTFRTNVVHNTSGSLIINADGDLGGSVELRGSDEDKPVIIDHISISSTNSTSPVQNLEAIKIESNSELSIRDVQLNANHIGQQTGRGGKIVISAVGNMSLGSEAASITSIGKGGGEIRIKASAELALAGSFDVSGRGASAGGTIRLTGESIRQTGTLEVVSKGGSAGTGGSVQIESTSTSAKLTLGEIAPAAIISDGVWRVGAPTNDSIQITSAGKLTIGADGIVSANAYTGGASTFAGKISLRSPGDMLIRGQIRADGNNGVITITSESNIDIAEETGSIHANAFSNKGVAGTISLIGQTATVNGGVSASTANGGTIRFTGTDFVVSATGSIKTVTAGTIELKGTPDQDLTATLNGKVTGLLSLDGDKSISVNFGAGAKSIEIKHVKAEGNVSILASSANFESSITIVPGVDDKSIESSGDVVLLASDIVLAVSNASGGSSQKISAENVTVTQSTLTGSLQIGTSIEAKQTITLSALGIIKQPGRNAILMANNVVLESSNENIGSNNYPLVVGGNNGASVNLSLQAPKASAYIQSLGDVTVANERVFTTFSLNTQSNKDGNGGNIVLQGTTTGQRIFLETGAKTNGSITFLASLDASASAMIEAGGSGDILGAPLAILSSPTLTLRTETGNIHSTASLAQLPPLAVPGAEVFNALLPFSLNINTENLTAISGLARTGPSGPGETAPPLSGGLVLLNNTSNQTLSINNSSGGLRFVVESAGSVRAGSIAAQFVGVQSGLDLTVLSGASVRAIGGSLELRALRTFSTQPVSVLSSTEGNVDIFGGTSVRIGNSTISATTASTDSTIGNVYLVARQESANLGPAQDIPGLRVNGTVFWDRNFKVNTGNAGENVANGTGRLVLFSTNAKNSIFLTGGATISAQGATNEASGFSPISYSSPGASGNTRQARLRDAVCWTDTPEGIGLLKDRLRISKGNMVLIAQNDLMVEAGNLKINAAQGTCIQVRVDGQGVIVRNIFDRHSDSVLVSDYRSSCRLVPGEELVQGNKIVSGVPHRASRRLNSTMLAQEFSIPGLLAKEKMIREVYSQNPKFRKNLLKTTASLLMVTVHRGPYSNSP